MKKKIVMLLGLCMMMLFVLGACGKDPTRQNYNGVTYKELQEISCNTVTILSELSEEDRLYYQQMGATAIVEMIDRWNEVTKDLGAYKGCGKFTVEKAGDTLTADLIVGFEKRDVDFQLIYSYHNMEQTGVMIEPVYSLGEKMGRAGMNTLISVLIVFSVLILISLIIYAFNIFAFLDKRKEARAKPAVAEPAADQVVSQIGQREAQLTDDLELVAVIAAAIAAATGTSADDFVVRSIRRR